MTDLRLAVKKQYFDEIKSGEKTEEYRLVTPFWTRRICRRVYKTITITLGYPKAGDHDRIITVPWNGYELRQITHPHFGPDPVRVYALKLTDKVRTAASPKMEE